MKISLRRAEHRDKERVFTLSNEPTVREVSFQKSAIPWASHSAWFDRSLDDQSLLFYVAFEEAMPESDQSFVGQFRLKPVGDLHELSISLVPDKRGAGRGRALLVEGLELARRAGVRRVRAAVKPDNIGSLRLFQGCGFDRMADRCTPEQEIFEYTLEEARRHE